MQIKLEDLQINGMTLKMALDHIEQKLIQEALQKTQNNQRQASFLLGMNRTTLSMKLRSKRQKIEQVK